MIMGGGSLEPLEYDFDKENIQKTARDKVNKTRNHCERTRQITDKLANLKKPVLTAIHGSSKMIDAGASG